MATLLSEDDEVKTSIDLILLKEKLENKPGISWISYKILLKSGDKSLLFEKLENNKGAGDYVLALTPVNEIEKLILGINTFLKSTNSKTFSFEPLEPSFELNIERSHEGYSINFWIDSGNVDSMHYTWDGFGIRLFTTEKKISKFVNDLQKEIEGLKEKM